MAACPRGAREIIQNGVQDRQDDRKMKKTDGSSNPNYETLAHEEPDSLEEELKALSNLHKLIILTDLELPSDNESSINEGLSDRGERCRDEVTDVVLDSSSCKLSLDELIKNNDDLSFVLCYVFERRYGWSEVEQSEEGVITGVRRASIVGRPSPRGATTAARISINIQDDALHKCQINSLLDDIINKLLMERLSAPLIQSLQFVILQAQTKPVVRSQCLVHTLHWLNVSVSYRENFPEDIFNLVMSVVVSGLCDVWSAVRNSCVLRLSPILDRFTLAQLRVFFERLVNICKDEMIGWQAKEGAVMGLACMLRRFQWVEVVPLEDEDSCNSAAASSLHSGAGVAAAAAGKKVVPDYFLKFGNEELKNIPEFISAELEGVVYQLLSHYQLTVREHAIKALTVYISRCDSTVALATFCSIIGHLNMDKSDAMATKSDQPIADDLQPTNQIEESLPFLDAFLAEALLGMCLNLIKRISSDQLIADWPLYSSAFYRYLAHPASTVRQATSGVFHRLVVRCSNNPMILKLVLTGLVVPWSPNMTRLTTDCDILQETEGVSTSHAKPAREYKRNSIADRWQWKEGVLLTYELIIQSLIKNHYNFLFGTANSHQHQQQQDMDGEQLQHPQDSQQLLRQGSFKRDTGNTRTRRESQTILNRHYTYSSLGVSTLPPQLNSSSAASFSSQGGGASFFSQGAAPRRPSADCGLVSAVNRDGSRPASLLQLCLLSEQEQLQEQQHHHRTAASSSPDLVDAREDCSTHSGDVCLGSLFSTILFQCIEGISDVQWEIRRMGQQLLPFVLEVFGFYDITIFVKLYETSFTQLATLMNYGFTISVNYLINHVATLEAISLRSFSTGLSGDETGRQSVQKIVSTVQDQLLVWSQDALRCLCNPIVTRLTLVSMETLLLVHAHFPLVAGIQDILAQGCGRIFSVLANVFYSANCDSLLSANLVKCPTFEPMTIVDSDHVLSCCTRQSVPGTKANSQQQAEKAVLLSLRGILPRFCQSVSLTTCPCLALLLPILSVYLAKYNKTDNNLSQSLLDSISSLSSAIGDNSYARTVASAACESEQGIAKEHEVKFAAIWSLRELVERIICSTDCFEVSALRKITNVCLSLSRYVDSTEQLTPIIRAISVKLKGLVGADGNSTNKTGHTVTAWAAPLTINRQNEMGCITGDVDIAILSNDIQSTMLEDIGSLNSDDSDTELTKDGMLDCSDSRSSRSFLHESQLLNLSGNSGSSLSPRPSTSASLCRPHHPLPPTTSPRPSSSSHTGLVEHGGGTSTHSAGASRKQRVLSISEGSDWDDWSDTETELASEVAENLLAEFLTTLKEDFCKSDRESMWNACEAQLGTKIQ